MDVVLNSNLLQKDQKNLNLLKSVTSDTDVRDSSLIHPQRTVSYVLTFNDLPEGGWNVFWISPTRTVAIVSESSSVS